MPDAVVVNGIYQKWIMLVDDLDERGRRRWAATEANFTAETFVEPDEAQRGSNDKSLRWINPRLR